MTRQPEYGAARTALETTLASDAKLSTPKHAALVSLCRITADQVDMAGAEVSSRLIASYLSALKDLERVMAGRTPGTMGGGATSGGNEKGAGGGKLGQLQSIAGGKVS